MSRPAVAIWRELGNPARVAWNLLDAGNAAYPRGAYERARPAYEQSREVFRKLDDDYGACCAANNLASTLYHLGEVEGARSLYRETFPFYEGTLAFLPPILACPPLSYRPDAKSPGH
jgi:tetratricopeptide (TPR) repeat protein